MDPSDLDLTQVIQAPDDTEDQNADNNIRALLKVEVDATPPKVLTFTLKGGSNLIGRSHLCDVIIGNNAVSKQHARLELDKNGITIMDLGSQNKTKIGQRPLKPEVYFNLDYNETFYLAGIKAHILRDNDNGAGDDTASDTCSESLLNAAEVAEDQAGVVEPVVHSNSSTADCNSGDRVEGELEQPATSSAAGVKQVVKPSSQNDSKPPSSHESRSSGSFNLPEMPSLEYTQSDSSQPAEPCAEAGSRNNGVAARASQDAHVLAGDGPSVGNAAVPEDATVGLRDDTESDAKLRMLKESHLTAETQPYADDDEFADAACLRQDGLPGDIADEVDRLNAPTQPYNTQYSEVTCLRQDGLPGDEADEADRLNAPTQPYNTQYDGVTCVRQDGQLGDEADEADRLNAPTQPYVDDVRNTRVAPLLSGGDADEADRFVAPTQGFEDEEEQAKPQDAPAQTSEADNEREGLNATTQSMPDDDDDAKLSDRDGKEGTYGRTPAGDRTRRLLSSADLSFVLCEATQPDKEEEEDDYFCPPTQKDTSPNLKVHALLQSRKERRGAADEEDETDDETDDETPNLSPKTTVDETPPHSPSFVPESDPEDDDLSMVTARRSLLNSTGMTVYEDCLTPGPGFGSPVIGSIGNVGRTSSAKLKTGEKRQRRGMSLRKPVHETILEQPVQEGVEGMEDLQEPGSELSKTARRLDYVEGTDAGDGGERVGTGDISGIEDLPSEISEPGKCAASETEVMPSTSGRVTEGPSARGTDSSEKDDVAEGNEEPFLHMSEMGDFDTPATETAGASATVQASAVTEGNKETTDFPEGAVSNKDTASPRELGDKSTEAKDGSGDAISDEEPAAEGKSTASKQTLCDDEVPLLVGAEGKDEPEKVLSEIEDEDDRTSTVKGRKKKVPPARKARSKKEVAPPKSKKDAAAEPVAVAPRRSSGRQNAGAKMKSLLSLEKRTSASGKFREGGFSQEACEKQDASASTDVQEAQNKAPKRTSKRGQKDSAKQAASPPLADDLPKASSSEHDPAPDVDEEGPKFSSKHDGDLPRGEASNRKDAITDQERPSEFSFADQQGDGIGDDYINATIDTCFSEPFPSFSQVLAECKDPEKAAAEDILKREQKEESEEKAPDSLAQDGEEGALEDSAEGPVPEASPKAPQSKSPKGDAAVIRSTRKKSAPATEVPSTRRKAVRHATQDNLPAAPEVLVEDTEFQESEAPKSALSRRAQGARPSTVEPKKARGKPKQLVVIEETEKPEDDTEADDVCAESDADEDTPSELEQTEALKSTSSRRSRRTGREASPSAVRPKRAGRKTKLLDVVEETEKPEDDTEADDVQAESDADEDTPSEVAQTEAAESASSRRSRRSGQEASPSAVGPKRTGRKAKQPEDDVEADDVRAESGAGQDTPSELQQSGEPESASSRRSRRTGREASPSATRPKRAGRKTKLLDVVEETEKPEDDTEADDVQAESDADEDTPSELEQTEAAESASSRHSRRTGREALPSAVGPKRTGRKAKQLESVAETEKAEDDTELDDVPAESGADEDTPSELQLSGEPESASSRRSRRTGREASPSAARPKRAGRKAKQLESVAETENAEDDTEVDVRAESGADEDTPSELQQSGEPESASSQGSQRRRRGTSPPAVEPKRARRKAKLLEVVEDSELPEDKTEMESARIGGEANRPSRVRTTPTPSQEEKSTSRSRSAKVSRLGMKRAKHSQEQDAEQVDRSAPTTAEDQTEGTGSQAAENTRGGRSKRLSLDRDSKAAADDSDFEQSESQGSRTSQRGKRGQKLSQEQASKSLVDKRLDDSALNVSVESEARMSSQRGKKGGKQSQGQDDLPPNEGTAQDSFEHTPALDESAVDNSWADISSPSGSQSLRTSKRVKKEKLSQEEGGHQPPAEKDTPAESQSTKTSRRTGKGTKLSQQKDQKPSSGAAVVSIPDESVVEPKPETVGASQRGKGRAKQLEIHEDLLATESVASDTTDDSAVSVETRNVRAPSGGKKDAKSLSQEQRSKQLESSAANVTEKCSEATAAQSSRTSRRVGARADPSKDGGKRASEEKTLVTSTEAPSKTEPAVAKTTQRGRKTKASSVQENQEQPPRSEPIKTSSRNKKQSIDEVKVKMEVIEEPPKRPPTRCRGSKVAPAAQPPAARKRNARGRGNEDSPSTSAMAVEETLEESSPHCSPPKVAKVKRRVISMSFGVGRRESEGEATSNEEVEVEETEMAPGPKPKPIAKNIVKQEAVAEVPQRGKRKAALAEDVSLCTPPKVKPEPAERGALMSPPSSKKVLKRKPRIMFTGIDCTGEEEIVKQLGGAIATTVSTCTHLVTDKFRRTVKSLCCIGMGTPIVELAWIKKCQQAKTFVDHTPFFLKDRKSEKSLNFVLDETLKQAASNGGVLQGWSIHATAHVMPTPADLKEIVSCAGGKYLAKMPTRATGGSTVIISCKEDMKTCTQARKNGVPIVSAEFVLTGLLQYKLDVGAYSLD